jgi:hypothetical protein
MPSTTPTFGAQRAIRGAAIVVGALVATAAALSPFLLPLLSAWLMRD